MNIIRAQKTNTKGGPFQLGLVGYPLGHSLSPRLHQAALSACGLAGEYQLFPVPPLPDGALQLERLLVRVHSGELHGLNVTIPHKQSVLEHLDQLSPSAKAIGAVNTIYALQGRLVGDNTDAPAFLADLHTVMGTTSDSRSAIILGAGGAARAVVFALLEDGWQVTVAARRLSQAEALVMDFQSPPNSTGSPTLERLQAIELTRSQLYEHAYRLSNFDSLDLLIVNTTPVGMSPHANDCPWPADLSFPRNAFVYDLVYNPPVTRLVQSARSQGIQAACGLGMLIEQAALAFEIWTGFPAPRRAMRSAVSDRNDSSTGMNNEPKK